MEKETREKGENLLNLRLDQTEQSIQREEEQRVANDGPINDSIQVLQSKQKNLENEIREQEAQNLQQETEIKEIILRLQGNI